MGHTRRLGAAGLPENVLGQITCRRVAALCFLEASLSSCGPATKSRPLGLWRAPSRSAS